MMLATQIPDGPFTWSMIRDSGVAREQLTAWVTNRQVRRILQGVYVRSDAPDDPRARARAAALVMRPFAVVCDRSAAWIHGVDTFEFRELEILPPLETWVLRNHSRIRRRACAGGQRDLAGGDIMTIGEIRLTTPLRTALDLGCRLSRREALAALDGFRRVHGLTHKDFERELPRYRRRRGVVQLRQLIPLADGRSESPGESWTRLCIVDDGLPCPTPQYWLVHRGVPIFRLDLAYPACRVAIEYDGSEFHDSVDQREHDAKRREWLRRHGWTVIVVRKDSFTGDVLAAWLIELRRALTARGRVAR